MSLDEIATALVTDRSRWNAAGASRKNTSQQGREEATVINDDGGWIMSSRSAGNGGSCFEARRHEGVIEVRNSKNPAAGTVRFTVEEWDSFLFGAKRGEFDTLLVD